MRQMPTFLHYIFQSQFIYGQNRWVEPSKNWKVQANGSFVDLKGVRLDFHPRQL